MQIYASKCSTSTREPDEKLAEVEHYHHAQTSLKTGAAKKKKKKKKNSFRIIFLKELDS